MDVQREQPVFSTISGTSMRLSERDTVAIYRWGGLSWVAQFRDGYGELSDAATWFRVHAGLLRSRWVGSPAALDTVEILTPEMVGRIAALHERVVAERARDDAAAAALVARIRRSCSQAVATLSVWRTRLLHRFG